MFQVEQISSSVVVLSTFKFTKSRFRFNIIKKFKTKARTNFTC